MKKTLVLSEGLPFALKTCTGRNFPPFSCCRDGFQSLSLS